MANTYYDYIIVDDPQFPNDVADPEVFELEIQNSDPEITSANLLGTECDGDPQNPAPVTKIRVWFDDPLSGGDQTQLNTLAAAHQGIQNKDIDTKTAAVATTDKFVLQKSNDKTDEAIALSKDVSGNMLFQDDEQTTPLTLTELLTSGGLLVPSEIGQILYSYNGLTFSITKPIISDNGFIITDDDGNIVVTG